MITCAEVSIKNISQHFLPKAKITHSIKIADAVCLMLQTKNCKYDVSYFFTKNEPLWKCSPKWMLVRLRWSHATDFGSRTIVERHGGYVFRLEDIVDENCIMHEFRRTLYVISKQDKMHSAYMSIWRHARRITVSAKKYKRNHHWKICRTSSARKCGKINWMIAIFYYRSIQIHCWKTLHSCDKIVRPCAFAKSLLKTLLPQINR